MWIPPQIAHRSQCFQEPQKLWMIRANARPLRVWLQLPDHHDAHILLSVMIQIQIHKYISIQTQTCGVEKFDCNQLIVETAPRGWQHLWSVINDTAHCILISVFSIIWEFLKREPLTQPIESIWLISWQHHSWKRGGRILVGGGGAGGSVGWGSGFTAVVSS